MVADSPAVPLWRILSSPRPLTINLVLIAAFGCLVPWRRGIDFFDPAVVAGYTAVALLLASSAVTALVSGRRTVDSAILSAAGYGAVLLAIIYGLGISIVNFTYHPSRMLHPDWPLLGSALLFAFSGGLFVAAAAATLAVLFSPEVSRTAIRAIFAIVLLAAYFGKSRLPPLWSAAIDRQMTTAGLTRIALAGSAVCVVLAAGLLYAHRQAPVLSSQAK
jgi:hypothetical protein